MPYQIARNGTLSGRVVRLFSNPQSLISTKRNTPRHIYPSLDSEGVVFSQLFNSSLPPHPKMRLPATLLSVRATPLATSIPRVFRARALSTSLRSMAEYQRTPLYEFHVENKARMVPFAGWSMPLSYGEVGQSQSTSPTPKSGSS
jgi:hypothetical protein